MMFTCFSSIFPVSSRSRRILTPSLPCRSLVTDSSTRLRNRLPTISNSTWTFEDPKDTNEAACPAGVGLSADASIARYSLIHTIFEAFLEPRARPVARSSSSDSCMAIPVTGIGSNPCEGPRKSRERKGLPDRTSAILVCLDSVAFNAARTTRAAPSLKRSLAAASISYVWQEFSHLQFHQQVMLRTVLRMWILNLSKLIRK